MTTSRLEAFSDGVFAIAATLLILTVQVHSSHLGQAPARAWPSYAARRRRPLGDDADPGIVSGITRSYVPGPWIYLPATLVALWMPTVSVVLFAAIAVFSMAESALFGRRQPVDA